MVRPPCSHPLLDMILLTKCIFFRTVNGYRVGTALSDDGLLASDHRPVFADVPI